jgi:Tol biopolymer transport system component
VPAEGGKEIEVIPEVIPAWFDWDISQSGIYYVSRVGMEFTLHYLDLATREVSDLLRREGIEAFENPSVSPDEGWIVYAEEPRSEADLVLVENFR